jgi:hypothetical protein
MGSQLAEDNVASEAADIITSEAPFINVQIHLLLLLVQIQASALMKQSFPTSNKTIISETKLHIFHFKISILIKICF